MSISQDSILHDTPNKPLQAIILHGQSERALNLATLHNICEGKLEFGQYIDVQEAISVLEHVDNSATPLSQLACLPARTVQINNQQIIWWREAQPTTLYHARSTHLEIVKRHVPALLFKRTQNSLNIWALADNVHPTSHTQLYHAPLLHISGSGSLCLGQASLPHDLYDIQGGEASYFEARSRHVNHTKTLSSKGAVSSEQLMNFWKRLGRKSFPTQRLVETQLRVGDIL